jgi:hypothetical protein
MSLSSATTEVLPWVKAELNYLAPTSERPRTYTYTPPDGIRPTTAVPEPHTVEISDVRPILKEVSLDEEGFALLRHAAPSPTFTTRRRSAFTIRRSSAC